MEKLSLLKRTSSTSEEKPLRSGARARVINQRQLEKGKQLKKQLPTESTEVKTQVESDSDRWSSSKTSFSKKSEDKPRFKNTPSKHSDSEVSDKSQRPYKKFEKRPQTEEKVFSNRGADRRGAYREMSDKRPSGRITSYRAPRKTEVHAKPAPEGFNYTIDTSFKLFASCPQGLEEALYEEFKSLGFQEVRLGRAGCHFTGQWVDVLKANLHSRIATRILLEVAHAPVYTEDDLYELTYSTPWEYWFGPEHELRVDTSAIGSPMKSLQFCNLKVKDGVCDRLRNKEGSRPNINTVRPDARVHSFLEKTSATLYIDTSGESLFKRGWRFDKGSAPLRENLAAGILSLSQWSPEIPLIDPFCGSGTILIEAAWKALEMSPGMFRRFAFERFRQFNKKEWIDLKNEVFDKKKEIVPAPIWGYDLSVESIRNARANLARAKLPLNCVEFKSLNALDLKRPPFEKGMIVTNPPYGERLGGTEGEFWSHWASLLKQNFSNWDIYVITADLELPKQMRLKPKRRFPLYNGNLDCRLFHFEMVADSYRK